MADDKHITRREVLKTMTAAGVCVTWLGPAAADTGSVAVPIRALTASENALVIAISEHIIPSDAHSPGATAAGVSEYIDRVLALLPELMPGWRAGLAAIDQTSEKMFGLPFLQATSAQQIALLTETSRNERNPTTEVERFFSRIKDATIDAYYTSKIGIEQELKYKGNAHLDEFPGCLHPEHR